MSEAQVEFRDNRVYAIKGHTLGELGWTHEQAVAWLESQPGVRRVRADGQGVRIVGDGGPLRIGDPA